MCPVTYEASQCPRRQNCHVAFRFRPTACGRLDGTWEGVTEFPGLGPCTAFPALEPWGVPGAWESHSPLGPGRASSLRSPGMIVGKPLSLRSKAERESQDQGKQSGCFHPTHLPSPASKAECPPPFFSGSQCCGSKPGVQPCPGHPFPSGTQQRICGPAAFSS